MLFLIPLLSIPSNVGIINCYCLLSLLCPILLPPPTLSFSSPSFPVFVFFPVSPTPLPTLSHAMCSSSTEVVESLKGGMEGDSVAGTSHSTTSTPSVSPASQTAANSLDRTWEGGSPVKEMEEHVGTAQQNEVQLWAENSKHVCVCLCMLIGLWRCLARHSHCIAWSMCVCT